MQATIQDPAGVTLGAGVPAYQHMGGAWVKCRQEVDLLVPGGGYLSFVEQGCVTSYCFLPKSDVNNAPKVTSSGQNDSMHLPKKQHSQNQSASQM